MENLSIVKSANKDIWDHLEGPLYATANVDTNNFIKTQSWATSGISHGYIPMFFLW
jgi:hypothetical protein